MQRDINRHILRVRRQIGPGVTHAAPGRATVEGRAKRVLGRLIHIGVDAVPNGTHHHPIRGAVGPGLRRRRADGFTTPVALHQVNRASALVHPQNPAIAGVGLAKDQFLSHPRLRRDGVLKEESGSVGERLSIYGHGAIASSSLRQAVVSAPRPPEVLHEPVVALEILGAPCPQKHLGVHICCAYAVHPGQQVRTCPHTIDKIAPGVPHDGEELVIARAEAGRVNASGPPAPLDGVGAQIDQPHLDTVVCRAGGEPKARIAVDGRAVDNLPREGPPTFSRKQCRGEATVGAGGAVDLEDTPAEAHHATGIHNRERPRSWLANTSRPQRGSLVGQETVKKQVTLIFSKKRPTCPNSHHRHNLIRQYSDSYLQITSRIRRRTTRDQNAKEVLAV